MKLFLQCFDMKHSGEENNKRRHFLGSWIDFIAFWGGSSDCLWQVIYSLGNLLSFRLNTKNIITCAYYVAKVKE